MSVAAVFNALSAGSPRPTSAGARVYAMLMPQGVAMPALCYSVVSTAPVVSLAGDSQKDLLMIQVDAYATTHAAAHQLAGEVRTAMRGLKSTPQGQRESYESDTKLHRVSLDFNVWQ